MHEQTRRVELRARAGQTPLDHLELRDRSPELPALFRVSDRDLERRAAEPDRQRADADTSFVEDLLDVIERFAVAADPIRGGDSAILEHELRGVGRMKAHLFFASADAKAGGPPRHPERRELALAGANEDHAEARDGSVGDELLRARKEVIVAVAAGAALRADRVGSG